MDAPQQPEANPDAAHSNGASRYDREITAESLDPLAFFASRIPGGASVLDIGCGPGVLGRTIRAVKQLSVDGIEGDPEAAGMARQYYDRVIEADLQNTDLEVLLGGRHYDYVVLADVLEHLEAPGLLVRQLDRVLQPGGRVLISIPNIGYMGVLGSLLSGQFEYDKWGILDCTHVRFFTRKSLHRFLELNGLQIVAEHGLEKPLPDSGFDPALLEKLDPVLREALLSSPDSAVCQFLVEAAPADMPADTMAYQTLTRRNVPVKVPARKEPASKPGGPAVASCPAPLPLFDPEYYLRIYPDIAAAGIDPYFHYMHNGAAEGRDPHPLFRTAYYLERYPEVAASGANPLVDYWESGAAKLRDPHPLFDTSYYMAQARLAGTGENPLLHYCTTGFKKGLNPHPLFDTALFLDQCREVGARGANPLIEFLSRHGASTPRPHVLFDTAYYLKMNPDVAEAPVNPFLHYLLFGWLEDRNPHPLFDQSFYHSQLPGKASPGCPLLHYVYEGARLGLKPHPWFDPEFYQSEHPEITATGEPALTHYLQKGFRLNFDPNPFFDSRAYLEKHSEKIPLGMSPLEHVVEHGDCPELAGLVRRSLVSQTSRISVSSPEGGPDLHPPYDPGAKVIAFYLPQYHPIEENDRWWGKGFTDWHNVARAKPLFAGHYQPRIPADLGFYDLRLPEILEQQAELATQHGIHGFCFYYYWFDGHMLLERPLAQMLARRSPQIPFCICWANETWCRNWDGGSREPLIEQTYSEGFAERFLRDVLPILTAPDYIRVNGAPLLVIYRIDQIPEVRRVTDVWRELFLRETGMQLHLAVREFPRMQDPRLSGFDSVVGFSPLIRLQPLHPSAVPGLSPDFQGRLEDYQAVVRRALLGRRFDWPFYPCVMSGWDDTARRGLRARVLLDTSPDTYQAWLEAAVALTLADRRKQDPLVFLFAWNEWAEGAYLEPDQKFGRAYLEATRNAIQLHAQRPTLEWKPAR